MKKIKSNPLGRERGDRETCFPEAAGEAARPKGER